MNRRKLSLAVSAIVTPAMLLAALAPAPALANGPMVDSHHHGVERHVVEHHVTEHHVFDHHVYEHHEHVHGVYINGVLTYGGGAYVVNSPIVSGSVFVYDLYARSCPENPWQLAGRYFVTQYPGSTDWGGFSDAQQSLASQGMQTFYRTTFWRTVQ